MAKVNETYEAMVIYSLNNGEEAVKALTEKFKAMIEANGTVESVNEWGKRKLAYEIDDQSEGLSGMHLRQKAEGSADAAQADSAGRKGN